MATSGKWWARVRVEWLLGELQIPQDCAVGRRVGTAADVNNRLYWWLGEKLNRERMSEQNQELLTNG